MKTIFKILVIVVVAVLVSGLFYGVVTAASSGTGQTGLPDRQFDRPDGGDRNSGFQFPTEAIKSLTIISVVGAIYLNYPKWLGRKKSVLEIP